jgi:hypothetical protein
VSTGEESHDFKHDGIPLNDTHDNCKYTLQCLILMSVAMIIAFMLNIIMLSIILLSIIMLSIIMLIVAA